MRRRILVLALIASAAVLAVVGWNLRSGPQRLTREDLARVRVRRADVNLSLKAGGRVESSQRTVIECQLESLAYSNEGRTLSATGSRVLELVDEGTRVHRDDVICRFDSSDYEELVRQQEIKVQQAKNDFEKAELDLKASEIALVEFPVSDSVIGRMRRWMKRPAPVWRLASSRGTADPVRMNCPGWPRSSTARRT